VIPFHSLVKLRSPAMFAAIIAVFIVIFIVAGDDRTGCGKARK
jgi:hypothetical protein